jgi:hypothetical protein
MEVFETIFLTQITHGDNCYHDELKIDFERILNVKAIFLSSSKVMKKMRVEILLYKIICCRF